MANNGSLRLNEAARRFGSDLPHTVAPYKSRAWGHSFHSLSSYQGKLKPSLAHWLVKEFTNVGQRVLDPLGGVGTVAFEAALQGRHAYSNDLSPFASTVARAKIAPPASRGLLADLDAFEADLENITLNDEDQVAAQFGLNARVSDYYHPNTLDEVLRARRVLVATDLSAERNFLKACLLHILHGNRPYALSRVSHPITPFSPSGPFEYRPLIDRLRTRCERLMAADWPPGFLPGQSWFSDFRNLPELLADPVDAIICSPPFPGMRFDRPNWLRMWFCGWTENDFHHTSRNFLERQQGVSFEIYNEFFTVCNELTSQGSPVVLHVGGSKSYDMADKLVNIGSRFLTHRSTIVEGVDHLEKHGIRDKGTTSSHIYLLFQR